MKKITLILFAALSGCYTTHNTSSIQGLSNQELCVQSRVRANTDLAHQEILNRGLMSAEDVRLASAKKIRIGMPECGLLSVYGRPNDGWAWCGEINRSTGSFGTHKQYVFRGCTGTKQTFYVYVENGVISGWQD